MPADKILTIEIFTDYVCPWCYLSSAAVDKIQQHYPVNFQWIPFPLHPETPEQGLSLSDLFQGRNMDAVHQQLQSRMDEAGLEYGERTMTYNSRLAQELAQWADTQEGGEAIHQALYRAYFVHNQNLADSQVLINIVKDLSLNEAAATQVLQERSFSEAVDEAWDRARAYQVTGVPCFIANNYMLAGCQPYEELEKFVQFLLKPTEPED
ncbi:DsbA family protein [Gammaproteobacteria bacterium]|nr:DsbA family protein [Gammaproteobacteria bacterium]